MTWSKYCRRCQRRTLKGRDLCSYCERATTTRKPGRPRVEVDLPAEEIERIIATELQAIRQRRSEAS